MSYHFKLNIENTQNDEEIALVTVFAEQQKKNPSYLFLTYFMKIWASIYSNHHLKRSFTEILLKCKLLKIEIFVEV